MCFLNMSAIVGRLMGVSWLDHGIDFVVILAADLSAAYLAIRIFESRKEAKARMSESLNQIFQASEQMITRYKGILKNYSSGSDSTATGISADLTDTDRSFFGQAKGRLTELIDELTKLKNLAEKKMKR